MAKSIRDIPKKRRGRPKTTGRGEGVMVRLHSDQMADLDAWSERQDDRPSRPEAIRRLVTIALESKKSAAQMAGEAIDELSDPTATNAEQLTRKRRLTKGPEEFRRQRADEVRRRK